MEYVVRTNLPSRAINSFFYNPHEGDLIIVFQTGGRYVYRKVPVDLVIEMCSTSSLGKFFHANIRNKYICEK